MKNNPMLTKYSSNETVPKWDPRIARRGALENLLAEAFLVYIESKEQAPDNLKRWLILETISDTLESCGCACESLASLTDTRRWELELADDGEWAQKMSSECEQLTAKWFPHLPGNVMGAHINVLRTHIRAVELLFCREDATEDEKMIQRVLNTLAKAAYVAMWTEGTDAE